MRISALLLMLGLAGGGTFWMNLAPPGVILACGGSQATAGTPAQPSPKMELHARNCLQLQPDQTATAEMEVRYPKPVVTDTPAGAGQEQKKDEPAKNPALDKGPSSEPGAAVKLYFDMQPTDAYPACSASVTSLMAEPLLKPRGHLKVPDLNHQLQSEGWKWDAVLERQQGTRRAGQARATEVAATVRGANRLPDHCSADLRGDRTGGFIRGAQAK
jgi:hypothetical protein